MGKKPNLMYANKGEYLWHFCCYYITIIICLDCHSIYSVLPSVFVLL